MITAFYDTKRYDRQHFEPAQESAGIRYRFHEFRLGADTAPTAADAGVVCVFVNDHLDRDCLGRLSGLGVRLVALR